MLEELALGVAGAYAATVSTLALLQGRLIFGRPTVIRPLVPGPYAGHHEFEALHLAVAQGVELQGWAAWPKARAHPTGVLLYFGGRNENVAWAPAMASFLGPWTVYAFNYRGFGESTGRASELHAKSDARRIVDEVFRLEHGVPENFSIMGRSLGCAIALAAARQVRPDKLVLLSPFDSLAAIVQPRTILATMRWAHWQTFDCLPDATATPARSLVLLAEDDARVPHRHSHRLADRLRNLQRVQVVADTNHRTLPRHLRTQQLVAAFLNAGSGHKGAMPPGG
jgi:pimeloyl-ACP methyl ester carboxylesterase